MSRYIQLCCCLYDRYREQARSYRLNGQIRGIWSARRPPRSAALIATRRKLAVIQYLLRTARIQIRHPRIRNPAICPAVFYSGNHRLDIPI